MFIHIVKIQAHAQSCDSLMISYVMIIVHNFLLPLTATGEQSSSNTILGIQCAHSLQSSDSSRLCYLHHAWWVTWDSSPPTEASCYPLYDILPYVCLMRCSSWGCCRHLLQQGLTCSSWSPISFLQGSLEQVELFPSPDMLLLSNYHIPQ